MEKIFFKISNVGIIPDTLSHELYKDVRRILTNDNEQQICLRHFGMEGNCFKGRDLITQTSMLIPMSSVKYCELVNVTVMSYKTQCGNLEVFHYIHRDYSEIIPTLSESYDFPQKELFKKPFFISVLNKCSIDRYGNKV